MVSVDVKHHVYISILAGTMATILPSAFFFGPHSTEFCLLFIITLAYIVKPILRQCTRCVITVLTIVISLRTTPHSGESTRE